MKKFLIYILISVTIIFCVSCTSLDTSSVDTSNMKSGIMDNRFSMLVPNDYQETSSDYIDKYYIKDNSASIIVTIDNNTIQYNNAKDYYSNAINQYKNTFDNVQEISSESSTVSDIYNAQIVEFSYQIYSQNDVIDMTCYVEYILLGSSTYIVTCSAPTDKYSTYKNDFIQSINSIVIND